MIWEPFLSFFVYPGLIATVLIALFSDWVIRKIKACLQARRGPPIYQPIADFIKLLTKEDVTPRQAHRHLFTLAPMAAFAAVLVVMLIIPFGTATPSIGFVGDVIVVIYLLAMVSVMIMVGASASANPFAAVGASREMMMMFAYEPALIVSILAVAIQSQSLSFVGIIQFQLEGGWMIAKLPIAFAVFIICMQASLGKLPFDIAEADQELIGGPFVEYSGRKLAIFRLVQFMKIVALSSLAVALFFPGPYMGHIGLDFLVQFAKIMGIVAVVAFIDALFPRAKINHAISFFWKVLLAVAFIDIVRALLF
ncbi:MAG: complex I subunit 1 family protein [Candidatus Bathyarchaeota archaeon]